MDKLYPKILPDLIVKTCPLGCNSQCARIWSNKAIGHRIVCKCSCGHCAKEKVLAEVEGPIANTSGVIEPIQAENLR